MSSFRTYNISTTRNDACKAKLLIKYKQVELEFSRCVKYVSAEFRVDLYIEVKGQTKVKVTWHVWAHLAVILTKINHDRSMSGCSSGGQCRVNNVIPLELRSAGIISLSTTYYNLIAQYYPGNITLILIANEINACLNMETLIIACGLWPKMVKESQRSNKKKKIMVIHRMTKSHILVIR